MKKNIQETFVVKIMTKKEELIIPNGDIIELNLVENIENFYMSGSITFYDKSGWRDSLEIKGGTFYPLLIMWKNEDEEFVKKMFMIYHTEPLVPATQLEAAFVQQKWLFVEPMFTSLTTQSYSKSWGESTKASTIFDDIFKNFMGYKDTSSFKYYEAPKETFDNFYMPTSTPGKTINWLKLRCSGSNSNMASGYLCFSNSLGMNFVTLSYMVEQEKLKHKREKRTSYVFGTTDDINGISDYSIEYPKRTDIYALGGTNSTTVSFDGKVIEENKISYTDTIQGISEESKVKTHGMAKSSLFSDISNYKPPVKLMGETDPEKMKNIQNNKFNFDYWSSLMARLTLKGSATRYAGMLIDISWKSATAKEGTDKSLEGLWLVRSITHQFVPGQSPTYRQLMVCSKPGYNTSEDKTYVSFDSETTDQDDLKIVKV